MKKERRKLRQIARKAEAESLAVSMQDYAAIERVLAEADARASCDPSLVGDWTIEAVQADEDNPYTGDQLWEDGQRPHFETKEEAEAAVEKMRKVWAALCPEDKPWGTPEFHVVNIKRLPPDYFLW